MSPLPDEDARASRRIPCWRRDAPTHKHFPYIPIAPQAEIDAVSK